MSEWVPTAAIDDGVLLIQLADSDVVNAFDIDCVVDLTEFGDVVGVEILDLRRQLSDGVVEASPVDGQINWSYDDEFDAFYVHVIDGRGQVQRSVTGKARLDSEKRLVQLELPIGS